MSNKSSSTSSPYNDWMEYQQQYMGAWKALGQFFPKEESKSSLTISPWNKALEQWWKTVSPSVSNDSKDYFMKMMEQANTFYFLGDQFGNFLQGLNELNKASDDWQTLLNDHFELMKSTYTETNNNVQETMHGMLGAWQLLPMDTLQRTLSTATVMPGDFFEDLKPEGIPSVTDKFLSVPGVGYTRESQELILNGIKLWNVYQRTAHEYNRALNKVGVNALEVMRLKILEMASQGKELNSLREIYDLWVDCNEKSYADFAHTEEYSKLYGRLTNALMAIKQHERNIIDESLGAMNMPTRRGMNTMQKRQQELRRDHKAALQEIKRHEKEIQELRNLITGEKNKITTDKNDVTKNKKVARKKARTEVSSKKRPKAARKKIQQKSVSDRKKSNIKKSASKKSGKRAGKDEMIVIKI